jgi:regulatory protein
VATSKRRNSLGRLEIDPFDARAARAAALDTLARRDYSSEDLRRRLLERGYDAVVIAPLLDALHTENLLNDRRFAENFVAYHAARGQGPQRVRVELKRHGIEGSLIQECIDSFSEWNVHLRRAQQKKFGAAVPSSAAERQRQARFLGYRGFTSAQIRTALGFDIDLGSADEET